MWAKGVFKGPTATSNDNSNNTAKVLFDDDDMTTIGGADDSETRNVAEKINKLESETSKTPQKQMEKQKQELEEMEKLKQLVLKRVLDKQKRDAGINKIQQKVLKVKKQRAIVAAKRIRQLRKQKKDNEIRKIVEEVSPDLPDVQSDESNDEYEIAKEVIELVAEKEKKRDVEDASVFFQNLPSSVKKPKVLEEVTPPSPEQKIDPMVSAMHKELTDIVNRATIPLLNFAGMVGVKLRVDYVSRLLVSKEQRSHIVELGENVEDFFEKNRDLGVNLLSLFMEGIEESLKQQAQAFEPVGGEIHPCFDLDDLEDVTTREIDPSLVGKIEVLTKAIDQLRINGGSSDLIQQKSKELENYKTQLAIQQSRVKLIGGDLEHRFAPAWAFHVMGSAVFRKVLSGTTLGAFETAFAEVRRIPNCRNFTMKELICSPDVHDKFAYLVAFSWLSSGDDTSQQVGGGGVGGKSRHNHHYLNIVKMRKEMQNEIDMCKIFFEVSVRRGKSKVKQAFEEAFQNRKAQKLQDLSSTDYVKWEVRMKLYLSQMPEYELFYFE